MKKILFSYVILLSPLASIFAANPVIQCREIQCNVVPRVRSESPPHIKIREGTSNNWSGYAAATSLSHPSSGSVSKVSGSWTVPTISSSSSDTFSSIWVGIDGYTSGTVEQIGTEHDWHKGSQVNYAWFEMYPRGSYQIVGFPLHIGDKISAEVVYEGSDTFKLTLTNETKHVKTTIPSSYTKMSGTKRSSAEWVVEAPSLSSGVLPLADFNKVTFTACEATINSKTGSISSSKWKDDEITMETSGGTVKADPSSLKSSGTSFEVTWEHK